MFGHINNASMKGIFCEMWTTEPWAAVSPPVIPLRSVHSAH